MVIEIEGATALPRRETQPRANSCGASTTSLTRLQCSDIQPLDYSCDSKPLAPRLASTPTTADLLYRLLRPQRHPYLSSQHHFPSLPSPPSPTLHHKYSNDVRNTSNILVLPNPLPALGVPRETRYFLECAGGQHGAGGTVGGQTVQDLDWR